MSHDARVALTIANGGTTSPALSSVWSKGQARSAIGVAADLIIYAPAALTGVVTIEISPSYGGALGWSTLQANGADVTVPAGKAISVPIGAFGDIRLKSAGAEGAARDFQLVFQEVMDN